MSEQVGRVVIGMDPHKRSVTIEVMTADEDVIGGRRFDTTVEGYAAMLEYVARWPQRVWAVEGCEGIGRHIAHRLLADGQDVVDVPAKLSARARVFATGQGRKTDATDAHSVALVGTRRYVPHTCERTRVHRRARPRGILEAGLGPLRRREASGCLTRKSARSCPSSVAPWAKRPGSPLSSLARSAEAE